jgi:hypothetical protein
MRHLDIRKVRQMVRKDLKYITPVFDMPRITVPVIIAVTTVRMVVQVHEIRWSA